MTPTTPAAIHAPCHSESDSSLTDVEQVRGLMKIEKPDDHLRYWPVAPLVNSIRNNGAELVTPIELGEPETLF